MSTVFCEKLQRQATPLSEPPYPGELGKAIQARFSQEAWDDWLLYQTKLINENRLNPIDPKSIALIEQHMQTYFFAKPTDQNHS